MVKSSSPSRAPLANSTLVTWTYTHFKDSSKQQQQQHSVATLAQATGFTGRLFFLVLTSLVLVCGRTLMLHTLGEQRGDAASAAYVRTGGTNSSRCKRSWPRTNTTPPQGDRARPGAGRRYELHVTAMIRNNRGSQDQDQLRTVEQTVGFAPMVQILDAPVAQMVEQLPNLTQFFDTLRPDPEQVIEVPKI